jgi:hypothetical protein
MELRVPVFKSSNLYLDFRLFYNIKVFYLLKIILSIKINSMLNLKLIYLFIIKK